MKIAVISDGIWPEKIGGIQKHSYELIFSLASLGWEIGVFYVSDNPGYFTRVFNKNVYLFPIQINALPSFFPGHYLFNLYLKSRKIKQELIKSSLNPNIIFLQGLIGWAFKNTGYQTISHLHGLEMFQKSFSLKEKIFKKAFRAIAKSIVKHTDYQCFYGPFTATLLLQLGAKRLIPFPNAVRIIRKESNTRQATRLFLSKKQPVSFVYLGRFEFRKGIPLLIKVLRELVVNFQFEFHFIGNIPTKAQFVHPQIFYHGAVQEEQKIRSFLQHADVLVLPSFAEGMPTSILEAMSEKTAIIATKVGENPLLVNDSNGWIIDPYRQTALKSALEKALKSDPKTLLNKGEKSYQIVQREFTWDHVISNFVDQLNREIEN